MARSEFETLRVYQLAETLADKIWNVVLKWDSFAKNTVGNQMVRAADSIGANIAEGNGRRDVKDNRRFVRIAWGSLNETQHFLRRAYKRNLITKSIADELSPIVSDLAPSLNAYHRSLTSEKLRTKQQISNNK